MNSSRACLDQKICSRPWHFGGWRGHHRVACSIDCAPSLSLCLGIRAGLWCREPSASPLLHHLSVFKEGSQVPRLQEQWCPLPACKAVVFIKRTPYKKIINAQKVDSFEEAYAYSKLYKCAHTCMGIGQIAVLLKLKWEQQDNCLCLLFLLCCSLVICLYFPSIIESPSLSPSLSPPSLAVCLSALGNIMIIKAKEYRRVWTLSISLCPLWPAIISHTHTHKQTTYSHTLMRTVYTQKHTHTHTSISSCDWITFWLIVLLRAKQW